MSNIQHCDIYCICHESNWEHCPHFRIRAIGFIFLAGLPEHVGPTLARKSFRAVGPRPARLEGNDP